MHKGTAGLPRLGAIYAGALATTTRYGRLPISGIITKSFAGAKALVLLRWKSNNATLFDLQVCSTTFRIYRCLVFG